MTKIPQKRHDDQELGQLRMRNAMSVRPPVQKIRNLALNPLFLSLNYVLCLTCVGLAIYKIYPYTLICSGITMVIALLIFWRKPRSRHHATLMIIISLLVLVFGSVYYFGQQADDSQRFIRY